MYKFGGKTNDRQGIGREFVFFAPFAHVKTAIYALSLHAKYSSHEAEEGSKAEQ